MTVGLVRNLINVYDYLTIFIVGLFSIILMAYIKNYYDQSVFFFAITDQLK